MKKQLTKADILAAKDIETKELDVPEWGGVVHLRQMSVAERSKFFDAMKEGSSGRMDAAQMLTIAILDDKGSPLFDISDAEKLCGKNGAVVDRVLSAWLDLNGLSKNSAGEAEKN